MGGLERLFPFEGCGDLVGRWIAAVSMISVAIYLVAFHPAGKEGFRFECTVPEVEKMRVASYEAYIAQEFVASSELMDKALDDLKGGHDLAIRIKDKALFWVYAIEWLVVIATLMATGSLLWTLMVRKRLYRATGTTQLL